MIQVTKDIWVNIMNVIWVEDVYKENQEYFYTKIMTIGGEIRITELRAEQVSNLLKLD